MTAPGLSGEITQTHQLKNSMSSLFVALQYLLPQHLLSRFIGVFASSKRLKTLLIKSFIRRYGVNMGEALIEDPERYSSFNEFFTRELKPGVRPLANGSNAVFCPADGAISQIGDINKDQLLQAKGKHYSVSDLLGGDMEWAVRFYDGCFATIYLSPRDYHRVHMPVSGQLQKMLYIPGKLFSVNQVTANSVANLFARNERAVCLFSTEAGPMAVILVGAMIVAGIDTVWSGQVCPGAGKRQIRISDYRDNTPPISISGGDEMGRFRLGSTAIVLFEPGAVSLDNSLESEAPVRVGQLLGNITSN
jgi:phosphatidylserine decarboxylase